MYDTIEQLEEIIAMKGKEEEDDGEEEGQQPG